VLPNGKVGVAYPNIIFSVTGGMAPYHFTVSSGSLPPGLSLSGSGTLSGTPTAIGTSAFDVFVTDVYGCSAIIRFCGIDVGANSCPAGTSITLSPSSLPAATPNAPYAQPIAAAGGTAPYTFSVSSGALPSGLGLNPVTGLISGIPIAAGSFAFTITATDANGCRGSRCYILGVGVAIPTISPWMLFVVSILLAGAGWIVIGRR
jgi:large repetitive protein